MLVTCPKCGFRQPKDQYCASCGVNMTAYQPPQKSFLQRFFLSPFVHIGLAAVLVGGSIFYIRTNNRNELQERIAFLKGLPSSDRQTKSQSVASSQRAAPPSNVNETSLSSASSEEAESATSPPNAEMAAPASAPPPAAAAPAASDSSQVGSAATGDRAVATSPPRFKITYATLPADEMRRLVEESAQAPNHVSSVFFSSGQIPNFKQKLAGAEKWQHLEVYESPQPIHEVDGKTQRVTWFDGVKDGDGDEGAALGLYHRVAVLENQGGRVRGEWELMVNLRDSADANAPIDQKQYVAGFELAHDQAAYMLGVLPKLALTPKEMDLFNNSFLRVMNSTSYRKEETPFIVLLEFSR